MYVPFWVYCFIVFSVYCLCKCVLYYCHRVSTQLQLKNLSYTQSRPKEPFLNEMGFPAWYEQIITQNIYTGCPRRNVKYFGRVFLMLNYADITQNSYIQSWTVTELMAVEKCRLLWCPRTVRRPWRNIHPLRKPGKAISPMQWPWRKVYIPVTLTSQDKERSGGLHTVLRSLRRAKTWMREFL